MEKAQSIALFGHTILPASRNRLNIPVVRLYTDTPIDLHVEVIHGRKKGPVLLVTAAIHGDELNGVEICRQLLGCKALDRIAGTVIIIPVVNQMGFIHQIRYLPDRRDLNRCFPGTPKGSLGARLAHLISQEIFPKVDYAVDLHTGAIHRTNLPQLRTDLSNDDCLNMARAFGAPVILDSKLRDGSFRHVAFEQNIPTLVYESGEALRLDKASIKCGLKGVLNVMRHLGMLPAKAKKISKIVPWECGESQWLRSGRDGLVLLHIKPGQLVQKGDVLMTVANPYDPMDVEPVVAAFDGVVIGMAQLPLANEGDALVHLAKISSALTTTIYNETTIENALEIGELMMPVPELDD